MPTKYAVMGTNILGTTVFFSVQNHSPNTVCASLSDKMSTAVEWYDECVANTEIGLQNPEVVRLEYVTEDVAAFKEAKLAVEALKAGLSNTELAILYGQL